MEEQAGSFNSSPHSLPPVVLYCNSSRVGYVEVEGQIRGSGSSATDEQMQLSHVDSFLGTLGRVWSSPASHELQYRAIGPIPAFVLLGCLCVCVCVL